MYLKRKTKSCLFWCYSGTHQYYIIYIVQKSKGEKYKLQLSFLQLEKVNFNDLLRTHHWSIKKLLLRVWCSQWFFEMVNCVPCCVFSLSPMQQPALQLSTIIKFFFFCLMNKTEFLLKIKLMEMFYSFE